MPRGKKGLSRQMGVYKKIGKALAKGAAKSMAKKKKPARKPAKSMGVKGKTRSRNIDRAVSRMSKGKKYR